MSQAPAERSEMPSGIGHPILILFGLGLLCHGWVMLTDYIVYDGWYVMRWIELGDFDGLHQFFCNVARPWHAYFYFPFCYLSHPLAAIKVVSVLLYISSFVCGYLTLRLTRVVSETEALLLTAVAMSLPFIKLIGEPAIFPYVIAVFIFQLAVTLCALGWLGRGSAPLSHWLRRVFSLALFALSFEAQFLLPLYYCYLGLWYYGSLVQPRRLSLRSFWSFVRVRADYALLPLVVAVVHSRLYPPQGAYAQYFHPGLSPTHIYHALSSLVSRCIIGESNETLGILLSSPVSCLGCLGLLWFLRRHLPARFHVLPSSHPRIFLGVGLLLLVGGIAAYAAVGREFAADGWYTRNSILLPIPLTCLLWAGVGYLLRTSGPTTKSLVTPGAIVLLVGCLATNWHAYATWQLNHLKEEAVAAAYLQFDPSGHFKVVVVRDDDKIGGTVDSYNYLYTYILGRERKVIRTAAVEPESDLLASVQQPTGIPPLQLPVEVLEKSFTSGTELQGIRMSDLDLNGPQVLMTVSARQTDRGAADWCMQYVIDRFFQPQKTGALLQQMVTVHFQELN